VPEKRIKNQENSTSARASLVLWCSSDGSIERIEQDSCSLVTGGCGSNLADLVVPSSHAKMLLFLKKLRKTAAVLDWECTVQLDGKLHLMKLSGIQADSSLLVLADPEAITLQNILLEISSLHCLEGATLTALVETYGCSSHVEPKNSQLFNEIIQLSNQQAALHRDLAKKTVALEASTSEMKKLNQLLATITDGIQDAILLLDTNSQVLWANKAAQANRREDLIGSHCHQSLKETDRACASPDSSCPVALSLASGRPESCEHVHFDLEGTAWYSEVTVFPIKNDDGKVSRLVRISKDITKRKQMEELLLQETLTDELTGIPNRRAFVQHSAIEWRRALRNKTPLTIAMVDIDLFKSYNDFYGHQQGDLCLRIVANCIKNALHRPGDLAARYGGEEFVVVLPDTDTDNAKTITDAIRANLQASAIPHRKSTITDTVTISIGSATTVPTLNNSLEKLIFTADKALYTAKRLGRNCVHRMTLRG